MFIRRDMKVSIKAALILFVVLAFGLMVRMGGAGTRFFSLGPTRLAIILSVTLMVATGVIFVGRALLWLICVWGEAHKQKVSFKEFVTRPHFDENLYAEFLAAGRMKW